MSEAVVIAGANGAGKTTFARELLPAMYPEVEFLNVDEVQTEGSIFAHPVAAGREVLRRLADAERRRDSFAIGPPCPRSCTRGGCDLGRRGDIVWSSISSSCPLMTSPCDVLRAASRLAGTQYPNRT